MKIRMEEFILYFFQFQQLITSGELPCSLEEAATLAGIHLHLDETWPDDDTLECTHLDENEVRERDHLLQVDAAYQRDRKPRAPLMQNRKMKITKTRRRGRLTHRLCLNTDDGLGWCFRIPDGKMSDCLPPIYRSSRKIRDLIEVWLSSCSH